MYVKEREDLEGDYHREKGQAAKCIRCRECEAKCPQNIPISKYMPIVHQVLGEGKSYDECPLPGRLRGEDNNV
jgi:predicted aldo/keto reductase-like oxidoreductase